MGSTAIGVVEWSGPKTPSRSEEVRLPRVTNHESGFSRGPASDSPEAAENVLYGAETPVWSSRTR